MLGAFTKNKAKCRNPADSNTAMGHLCGKIANSRHRSGSKSFGTVLVSSRSDSCSPLDLFSCLSFRSGRSVRFLSSQRVFLGYSLMLLVVLQKLRYEGGLFLSTGGTISSVINMRSLLPSVAIPFALGLIFLRPIPFLAATIASLVSAWRRVPHTEPALCNSLVIVQTFRGEVH
jgi:hypothetical protein